MTRTPRTSALCVLILGIVTTFGLTSTQLQAQDSPQANQIADLASNAQNAADYETAAENWEKLIDKHPDFSQLGKAHFNCGKCFQQLNQFKKAIFHFKAATQKLGDEAKVALPESYLYLGFCQSELGQNLLDSDPDQAKTLLTTSVQTFATQLRKFEDYEHNDQACYFQGIAYEVLERLEDAAKSYEKMFDLNPNTGFKNEGLFYLGNVYEQLGRYDDAMKKYNEFLDIGKEDVNYDEVRFRTAETLWQMAAAARQIGDRDVYVQRLIEARALYGEVAAIAGFDFQSDAQFQEAVCSRRLEEPALAAKQFEAIALSDGPRSEQAAVLAGREFVKANDLTKAEMFLKQVLRDGQKFAPEAAHRYAQLNLNLLGQPQAAFKLADDWLQKTDKANPYYVELLQDKAEAAFLLNEHRDDSPQMFMLIAEQFPDHPKAAVAMYSAAFAYLEVGKLPKAMETSLEFESKFADNEYLPDVLEVKADVFLLQNQLEDSQAIFERLVRDFGTREKSPVWRIRVGLVRNMRDQFQEAINWLEPEVNQFTDKTLKAEALHWIGASYLALENFAKAEASLAQSVSADPKWRLAAETLYALAQAKMKQNKGADADVVLTQLRRDFPTAPQVVEADYRAAEKAFSAGDFETAIKLYRSVMNNFPESPFVSYSALGIAWAKMQQNQLAEAETEFTQFLTNFADTELASEALLGRGMTRRKNGSAEGAVVDLKKFLSENADHPQRIEARYELGLAQIKTGAAADAIETYRDLIDDQPTHKLADRFHYELAWLYSKNDQADEANKEFTHLADSFPDSDLAPEANFKVGERAYGASDFDTAVRRFLLCRNSGGEESLREKAAYRLGWCYFKQDQFDKAHEMFEQQVGLFKNGKFTADGWVMKGESLYNQNKMEEAYQAYRVAKPAIDGGGQVSKRNDWLTMLHGSVSANRIGEHEQSVAFVDSLLESDATESIKLEGWYEKGVALRSLKRKNEAMEAFAEAGKSLGKTGAQAKCMMGDLFFVDQRFDEAIDLYKEVFYGFGGTRKDPEVDPWQAYALYHAARCNFVQISAAADSLKPKLITDATKFYENLITNYPDAKLAEGDSTLASKAQKDLEVLKQLNN